jgi:hypothetical protein
MNGMMGSQFGSLMEKSSSGGWTYDESTGTYSNRFTGEKMTADEFAYYSQDANWVAANLNVGWADFSTWAIFETGASLDNGRTFSGNGNFGIVKIGSVFPTNNNVIFTSRESAKYFLKHRDPWFTLDPNDKIVASIGLFGTWITSNKGTFRIRKSGRLSFKYYSSGWRTGNQYVDELFSVSKVGSGVSLGADIYLTYNAYNNIFSNQGARLIDYFDAGFGSAGIVNSTKELLFRSSIPIVGEVVALYGVFRLTWDVFYDLGAQYGPFF